MFGYAGKMLSIDLSNGEISKQDLDWETTAKFIGGTGLSSKILYDEVGPHVDPLGPDNIIVFATGPLTGTQAPANGRVEVTTKSPLTGVLASVNTGGFWGPALKWAGYDVLIVRKASQKPVYIWIDDGNVEVKRADHLWGKDTWETSDILREELRERRENEISVMAIGPAGENLVRFSCLTNEYYHVAARCGVGAVMGSKKLKAIAVRGTRKVAVARPKEFKEATKEAVQRIKGCMPIAMNDYRRFGPLGTPRQWYNRGCLPGKNSQVGILPGWLENVTLEVAKDYITKSYGSCFGCPIRCFNMVEVKHGKYAGLSISTGTMNHPIAQFGARLAIPNLPFIWQCKEVCHRLGMDTGSAAGVIAFAMELYQRGIISKADTDGVKLEWGSEDAALEMLEKIAYRRGFGDVLADGAALAAKKIGKDSEKYALTIKGLEIIGSDPRVGGRLWNAGCLDDPRGGDNIRNTHTLARRMPTSEELEKLGLTEEEYPKVYVDHLDIFEDVKTQAFGVPPRLDDSAFGQRAAVLSKWFGDLCSVMNSLIVCILPTVILNALGPTYYAKLLSACTGIDVTPLELMKIGERIYNLQRMYSVRSGLDRKHDDFPARFYDEPLREGPRDGARLSREEVQKYLDEYYRLRGWDERTGIPKPEKLNELGLS